MDTDDNVELQLGDPQPEEWLIPVNGHALQALLFAIMEGPDELMEFLAECGEQEEASPIVSLVNSYNKDIAESNATLDAIFGVSERGH